MHPVEGLAALDLLKALAGNPGPDPAPRGRAAVRAGLGVQPAGDQPQAIVELVDGLRRRRTRPGAPGGDRLGQDLHHGARHRRDAAAGRSCWRRTRSWRRSSTASSSRSSRTTRSSTSSATTTTTSRKPTSRAPTPISRRPRASTSRSTGCATRRPGRCSSATTSIIVASVSCIYGIGSPETYARMTLTLQPGPEGRAAAAAARPGRAAVPPQRAGLRPRRLPRQGRHDRDLPGPSGGPRLAAVDVRRRGREHHRVRPAHRREDWRSSSRSASTRTATT